MGAGRSVKPAGGKARLGQNFLTDPGASAKIVDALGDVSRDLVVEIGPGKGAITRSLVRKADHVVAIELDRVLAAQLRYEFTHAENIEIIEADVLQVDLDSLLRPFGDIRAQLVGNLPYYITSDILLKLFAGHRHFSQWVIMVQKEVADRLAARPGSRDYGLLTVTAQLYCDIDRLFTLPPGAFSPAPKVHSTVLRFRIAPKYQQLGVEPARFIEYLKLCFAQKRKTLANNLKPHFREGVTSAIEKVATKADVRAEALTLTQLAAIHTILLRDHP